MPRPKKEYVRTTVYNHPKIWEAFQKRLAKENRLKSEELERERTASEVLRHLQLMYVNFGEDLFKITKI